MRKVWILICPGSAPLDVAGPVDVLRRTNDYTPNDGYELVLIGATDRLVTTASGMSVMTQATVAEAASQGLPHTVMVCGGDPACAPGSSEAFFAQWLAHHAQYIPRICSVCSGAFVLAEAGLLDGKRATTHWDLIAEFRTRFPKVQVVNDTLFVKDDHVWTSAGVTSGIDLALSIVEEDWGHEISIAIARFLVLFLRRSGNQRQFSTPLAGQLSERRNLCELQTFIASHLNEDLSIDRLAEVSMMSPRNLSRVFKKDLGITPGQFVRTLRLDEARRLLESTDLSVSEIAKKVGSGDEGTLRRWFSSEFDIAPSQYRERFSTQNQ